MTVTSGAPGSPRRRMSGSKAIRQSEARFSFLIRSKRAIASVIAPSGPRRLVSR